MRAPAGGAGRGNPRRCRWAGLFWPFKPGTRMQIDSKNNDDALALGWQNGPGCSTMLPSSCPLASSARCNALPRAQIRKWEREEIFLKLVTLGNTG